MLICQNKIENPLPEGCYFEVNSFFYYYVGAFVGVNYKHLLEYNTQVSDLDFKPFEHTL